MSLLDQSPESLAAQSVDLSQTEFATRDVEHALGTMIGEAVVLMGVNPAMQLFHRSEMRDHLPEPFVPYQPNRYPELIPFDSALAIDCTFTASGETHLYNKSLWVNYGEGNQAGLAPDTIAYWGLIGADRQTAQQTKLLLASNVSSDEAVKLHNQDLAAAFRYERLKRIIDEEFAELLVQF